MQNWLQSSVCAVCGWQTVMQKNSISINIITIIVVIIIIINTVMW